MKKKIFIALAAVVAGFAALTGCQKEKPYTSYEIGSMFSGVPEKAANDTRSIPEWLQSLSIEEQELYKVANYMAGWLIENHYIRTKKIGNPIVLEGDDLVSQDRTAYTVYQNMQVELDRVNLDEVIVAAQKQQETNTKLELTTSGYLSFGYVITGITTMSIDEYPQIKWYGVNYGPLNADLE